MVAVRHGGTDGVLGAVGDEGAEVALFQGAPLLLLAAAEELLTRPIAALLRRRVALSWNERRKEMFYLTTHSTHFIYGYMASDIWLRTILIVREEGRKEMFYLTTHSTHFIYRYMASDIW